MMYEYREIVRTLLGRRTTLAGIVGKGPSSDALLQSPALGATEALHSLSANTPTLLVVCNLLEQRDEDELPVLLETLKKTNRPLLFVISTIFSPFLDEAGSNLVRTIKAPGWWEDKLRAVFASVFELPPVEQHSCMFLTAHPGVLRDLRLKALCRLDRWGKSIATRERMKRLSASGPPNHAISESNLFDEIEGRSVALVGNAARLGASALGQEIDGHDIVVRMNRAPIINVRSHGMRTDWIATSVDIPEELMTIRRAGTVLWMSPGYKRLPEWTLSWPRSYFLTKDDRDQMTAQLGARPSTGFSVINLLYRSPAALIRLYGFDFFESQSLSGHRAASQSPHDFAAERRRLMEIMKSDPRFILR